MQMNQSGHLIGRERFLMIGTALWLVTAQMSVLYYSVMPVKVDKIEYLLDIQDYQAFSVTDASGPAILGCKTWEELDLIKVHCSLESIDEKQVYIPLTKESLSDVQDCFEGLGTFNMKPYHSVSP